MEDNKVTTQEGQETKKKGGKVVGILLLIVILVVGGVIGYFVLTKGKESKKENTKTEEKQAEKKNERKGPIVPTGDDIREELESVFKRDFDKDAKHMTVPADDFDEEDKDDEGCSSNTDKYEYGDYVVSIFQEECLGTVEIVIYDKEGKELRKLDDIFAFVYEDGDTDVSNDIVCSPIIVDGRLYYIRTSNVDSEDTIPNYLEYIDLKDNLKTEVIKEYQLYHGVE